MIIRFIAMLFLVWILGFFAFAIFLPQSAPAEQKSDGLIVLTGSGERISRGFDLMDDHAAKRMLISGVDRDVRREELASLYKADRKIFDCCVDLGFKAVDTRSNAVESARWVARNKAKSIRLVTSDWHMRRARLELDMVLDSNVDVLEDAVPSKPSLATLFKEYNKFWLRWISALAGV